MSWDAELSAAGIYYSIVKAPNPNAGGFLVTVMLSQEPGGNGYAVSVVSSDGTIATGVAAAFSEWNASKAAFPTFS